MKTLTLTTIMLIHILNYVAQSQTPDLTNAFNWYKDADRDGNGNVEQMIISASRPAGYVASAGDLNDADAACFAGAEDICDGKDNDFDGIIDEDLFAPTLFPSDSVILNDANLLPVYCTSVGAGFVYTWYKDDVLLPGETASYIQVSTPGQYKVYVQTPGNCSGFTVALTVKEALQSPQQNAGITQTF